MASLRSVFIMLIGLAPDASFAVEPPAKISEARKSPDGYLVHTVESAFQKNPTEVQVLLPDKVAKDRKYQVVYVLPVEAGVEKRFGDGLLEVKKLDLHNKLDLIFVRPTFAQLPWYADHPTDPAKRQETYFLKVVLPLVEANYPAKAERDGRLLLGFSKSGWGAFSLLLRHPDVFGRASAWDAPLNLDNHRMFGMAEIVGTPENFKAYRVSTLIDSRASELGKAPRLGLMGYQNFHDHHKAIHAQLDRLKVPHLNRDEPSPKHVWDGGWIEPSVRFLTTGKVE